MTIQTLVSKVISLLFNALSRFAIAGGLLIQCDLSPYQKGKFGHRHTGGGCRRKMQAEIRVMFVQPRKAKEDQQLPKS